MYTCHCSVRNRAVGRSHVRIQVPLLPVCLLSPFAPQAQGIHPLVCAFAFSPSFRSSLLISSNSASLPLFRRASPSCAPAILFSTSLSIVASGPKPSASLSSADSKTLNLSRCVDKKVILSEADVIPAGINVPDRLRSSACTSLLLVPPEAFAVPSVALSSP